MNRTAFVLAAAVLGAAVATARAAGPAPVDRHSSLAPADWALREAEADLGDLELPPAEAAARDAAMCGPGLSVDQAMASFNGGRVPSWAAPEIDRVILLVVAYYRCRAYAEKDRAVCDPLKSFDLKRDDPGLAAAAPELKPHDRSFGCFGRMQEWSLVRAYVSRDPGFEKVCAPTLLAVQEFEKTQFKDADVPRVCAILAERRDPAATCARLKPLYADPEEEGTCLQTIERLHGEACAGPVTIEKDESCRSYVAFRRAFAAKDARLCEGWPVCQILMGGGTRSCQPYAESFRGLFCVSRAERLARLGREIREADAALAALSGSDDPALAGLRARREALGPRFTRVASAADGGR